MGLGECSAIALTKEVMREGHSWATDRPKIDLGCPEPRPKPSGRRPFGPTGHLPG